MQSFKNPEILHVGFERNDDDSEKNSAMKNRKRSRFIPDVS